MNHNLAKQIEQRSVEELIPYARNARTHSEAQVTQLARSIEQFGFTNPVLIDAANSIIAGHGRVMAAKQLGMATVPCLRVDWLTEAQQRAYVLADNQLALQAGWDEDLLALELRDLQDLNFDMDLIGFDDSELDALMGGQTEERQKPEKKLLDVKYQILVDCSNEKDQARILAKLEKEGMTCRPLIL